MSGDAGEENEDRCAEVGDPSCKKKGGTRMVEIGRIIDERIAMEIIPYVIDSHDDHYCTSQEINRFDTRGRIFYRHMIEGRAGCNDGGFI